jgi:hypothetical protein
MTWTARSTAYPAEPPVVNTPAHERPARRLTDDDCITCGACCCNPSENRRDGYMDYVQVRTTDVALRKRPDLLDELTVVNASGERHMRLVGDEQRCAALHGEPGRAVACSIYAVRPRNCHLVRAGDPTCLRLRAEKGIG